MLGTGTRRLRPRNSSDLIPNLATREELNEWERENILRARRWALGRRNFRQRIPSRMNTFENFTTRCLIRRGNGQAVYRKTEKNIGVPVPQMREMLVALLGDARYWIENNTYPADEIAVRFHHRLVLIHLFPNGNGRHARLIADVLAVKSGKTCLYLGRAQSDKPGEAREKYLQALRTADAGDVAPLIEFARS